MQHHVRVGMVYGVSKGHRAAALVLVHVEQFACEGFLHETLEGLHHLGYQLVQCEQYVAVGACTHHRNQSVDQSISLSINHLMKQVQLLMPAFTTAVNQSIDQSTDQSVHQSITLLLG